MGTTPPTESRLAPGCAPWATIPDLERENRIPLFAADQDLRPLGPAKRALCADGSSRPPIIGMACVSCKVLIMPREVTAAAKDENVGGAGNARLPSVRENPIVRLKRASTTNRTVRCLTRLSSTVDSVGPAGPPVARHEAVSERQGINGRLLRAVGAVRYSWGLPDSGNTRKGRTAPTTADRIGSVRQPGPSERDGAAYTCRTQWLNPLRLGP